METEQVYTIPLRDVNKVPRWKRSNRAVIEVRSYLARHMKTLPENIAFDNSLNEVIWARGSQKPPRKVRVKAVKFEDGGVEAEFAGEQRR
ncbi:MAG: 50S ribosomal protein L31e [Methanotrichaceae archaeon]